MAVHNKIQAPQISNSTNQQGQGGGDKSKAEYFEGDRRACTVGTIAAQSGRSQIVVALLKDGDLARLKVQEMRPRMLEVGANLDESTALKLEQSRLVDNLKAQSPSPIDGWWQKYQLLNREKGPISAERKLVYLCMAENVQACWRSLLSQLEQRSHLLDQTCTFYEACEQLKKTLDRADRHVQRFRSDLLDGPSSAQFDQARNELTALNKLILDNYALAKLEQEQLIERVGSIANSNLADSRPNRLIDDAQSLIRYLLAYLDPLERRKVQIESVVTTTTTSIKTTTQTEYKQLQRRHNVTRDDTKPTRVASSIPTSQLTSDYRELISSRRFEDQSSLHMTPKHNSNVREIQNFNDLNLVENWLSLKIEQLNSNLLSSLGIGLQDSRTVLSKHEQIALECRSIEEAALLFNGRSVHSIKSEEGDQGGQPAGLLEQQRQLANRARDVISILDARIVLLRRTIDFYLRSREAATDIGTMLRRLQVDNSLQSVQFVANELELKDVSSVVASGATILSELQQLQLAQQHGQRSRLISLNLVTGGIRAVIDQLNQELANLKTVLSQRRLVLLNEDATKMASNFTTKCQQLQYWLDSQAKVFLSNNNRVPVNPVGLVRVYNDTHTQMRVALQNKTLEVEALLRSLPTLIENFDPKSKQAEELQRVSDDLRHDWIQVTNQLDNRLDLVKKYVSLLEALGAFERQIESLDRFNSGNMDAANGRTCDELWSAIDQSKVMLANQLQKFDRETQQRPSPSSTGAERAEPEVNWQQLVEFASDEYGRLIARTRPTRAHSTVRMQSFQEASINQPAKVPIFSRPLGADRQVEPFSTVELECETSESARVEWFMNNFKRIPQSIKHSIMSSGNTHRLTINNFGPTCCGTYIACASNEAGQTSSQCRLRLLGIQEDTNEQQHQTELTTWSVPDGSEHISRLIKGVDAYDVTQKSNNALPVTHSIYSGTERQQQYLCPPGNQPRYYVESPVSSSSLASRSLSKSPLEGAPQAPVFVQGLRETMSRSESRAGLVCVVVGNPPPTIEWLHNKQTIATAKCQKPSNGPNLCKLTIETMSDGTRGQYECRATNRAGKSSTGIVLNK